VPYCHKYTFTDCFFSDFAHWVIFVVIFFSLNTTTEKPTPIDWSYYDGAVKNKALVEKMKAAVSETIIHSSISFFGVED